MSEDIYQVYRRIGTWVDLLASDMTIEDAVLFIKAYMQDNWADTETSLELQRQPLDYGVCNKDGNADD